MQGSIRRYDVQATYSVALALAALLPCLAAVGLALRNYQSDLGQIVYGSKGYFLPLFAGSTLISLLLAGVAFVLGWNSAGQRRNDKPRRSWIGFFLGGTVASMDVILLIAFYMLRLERSI